MTPGLKRQLRARVKKMFSQKLFNLYKIIRYIFYIFDCFARSNQDIFLSFKKSTRKTRAMTKKSLEPQNGRGTQPNTATTSSHEGDVHQEAVVLVKPSKNQMVFILIFLYEFDRHIYKQFSIFFIEVVAESSRQTQSMTQNTPDQQNEKGCDVPFDANNSDNQKRSVIQLIFLIILNIEDDKLRNG